MSTVFSTSINQLIGGAMPFALYYLPGKTHLEFIAGEAQVLNASLTDDDNNEGFVFAPYRLSVAHPLYFINADIYACGLDAIIAKAKNINVSNIVKNSACQLSQSATEEGFISIVTEAIEKINTEDSFKKVVLSRPLNIELPPDFDTGTTLLKMQEEMPNAFCYMAYIPGQELWMGATPERLLELDGSKAQTNALAGTLPSETKDLWSDKERDEQQIVTHYIAKQLQDVGIGNYDIEGPHEIVSGSVRHLRSVFSFSINNQKQILSVVDALHPTPAICGMPKLEADDFIAKNENYSREYYAGYLGPLGINGDTHIFVNLRCMKVCDNRATLYVGAGITEGSEPQKEWDETCVKALTLLNVIRK